MEPVRNVGNYELEGTIGAGGHGVVYRSTHPVLGTPVAIKVLHDRQTVDARGRAQLLDEARSMLRLRHAGIVHVYDVGEHDGRLYLVMELLEHGSLRERLRRGALGTGAALALGRALAAALAYAHSQGVLHRDLKPENVLLRADGAPVIADFGLPGGSAPLAGTPVYMAPEQLQARGVDQRTDVYALGVLLYEMIAGGPPFGPGIDAAIDGHLHARPPQLRSFDELVPAEADALIGAMLSKDPAGRPATMPAVLRALDRVLGRNATVALEPSQYSWVPAERPARPAAADSAGRATRRAQPPITRLGMAIIACGLLVAAFAIGGSVGSRLERERIAGASAAAAVPAASASAATPAPPIVRSTEVPLSPVDLPITSAAELVEPRPVALGQERFSVGSVGVYQDGTAIRVYGLLRNELDQARRKVEVRVILRDAGGAELVSAAAPVDLFLLRPQAVAPFSVVLDQTSLPVEGSYTVDFAVRGEAADERDVQGWLPVRLSNVAVGRRDRDWAFEGRMAAGERTVEGPEALAVFMDGDGVVVGIGRGRLKSMELTMPPGTEADFGGTAAFLEKQPVRVLLLSEGREYLSE